MPPTVPYSIFFKNLVTIAFIVAILLCVGILIYQLIHPYFPKILALIERVPNRTWYRYKKWKTGEETKPIIFCSSCKGTGKIKCGYCTNGFQSPNAEVTGYSTSSELEKKDGKYFFKIHGINYENKGIKGNAILRVGIRDSRSSELLSEDLKKVPLVGFVKRSENYSFDYEKNFDLGDLSKFIKRFGREPNKDDFVLEVVLENQEPKIKCEKCEKGFLICPECRGTGKLN